MSTISVPLREMLELIKFPVISDKATRLLETNKYTFLVDKKANKKIIKTSIEYLFNVKVEKVNTLRLPSKKRKVGRFIGTKPSYKKAIVSLAEDNRINLFPDN
jgi:large subunit ribosomal protein L23